MKRRTKKLLSLLLTGAMVFSLPFSALADTEAETEAEAAGDQNMEVPQDIYPSEPVMEWSSETVPLYFPIIFADQEQEQEQEITLHFRDSDTGRDIPYISMEDGLDLLVRIEALIKDKDLPEISTMFMNSVLCVMRSDSLAVLHCDDGRITFENYNGFYHSENDGLLDLEYKEGMMDTGYLTTGEYSYRRNGRTVTFDLAEYGIDMYQMGEDVYLPMQTFCDIFLMDLDSSLLYNKESVSLAISSDTSLNDFYYNGKAGLRSDELIYFTYDELCMVLDANYGLKEEHNIESFEELFRDTGLLIPLYSYNPIDVAQGINELTRGYLGDSHSGLLAPSYLAGAPTITWNGEKVSDVETAPNFWEDSSSLYEEARRDAMGDEIPAYEEIGNTAYVTFDDFSMNDDDYYTTSVSSDEEDTVGILIYAQSRIMREDSPIENVVLDLSNNGGGYIDSAIYTLSWLLGSCTLSLQDSLTKAQSSSTYQADLNLDHEYNELDTVQSKNVFVLISPSSFSCGNLVPAVCKAASGGKVTLIGETSGGGACSVQFMSLADGTRMAISSRIQISYVNNGAFHNVEDGVEPDVRITKPENLYDRESLTEYINEIR